MGHSIHASTGTAAVLEADRIVTGEDRRQGLNQSVEKAMAIIAAFNPEHPHLGVNELARKMGLSRSAVSRLLASLEVCGFVAKDPRTGRFRLGVSVLELAYAYFQTSELVLRAAPYVSELARRLEMHTHLFGLADGQLFRYLWVPFPAGVGMLAGFRGLPHVTAAGKVLLSHSADEEVADVIRRWGLPSVTTNSITDREQFLAQIAEVRRQGYALDDEESKVGTRCVAVPVQDAGGTVVAAVSVSAPSSRLPAGQVARIRDQLLEAAEHISMALGSGIVPAVSQNGRER